MATNRKPKYRNLASFFYYSPSILAIAHLQKSFSFSIVKFLIVYLFGKNFATYKNKLIRTLCCFSKCFHQVPIMFRVIFTNFATGIQCSQNVFQHVPKSNNKEQHMEQQYRKHHNMLIFRNHFSVSNANVLIY